MKPKPIEIPKGKEDDPHWKAYVEWAADKPLMTEIGFRADLLDTVWREKMSTQEAYEHMLKTDGEEKLNRIWLTEGDS